jgi:hypothetical protein
VNARVRTGAWGVAEKTLSDRRDDANKKDELIKTTDRAFSRAQHNKQHEQFDRRK